MTTFEATRIICAVLDQAIHAEARHSGRFYIRNDYELATTLEHELQTNDIHFQSWIRQHYIVPSYPRPNNIWDLLKGQILEHLLHGLKKSGFIDDTIKKEA